MPPREIPDDRSKYVLTSSQFASAIGVGRVSRAKLWRVITGLETDEPDEFAKGMMAWGSENEHRAIAKVAALTGCFPEYTGEDQASWDIEGYSATPDGLIYFEDDAWLVEVKCPTTHRTHPLTPDEYMPQVQGQLMCCGMARGVVFGVWTPEHFRAWTVPRSQEYIDAMLEHLEEFRRLVIENQEPPEVVEQGESQAGFA